MQGLSLNTPPKPKQAKGYESHEGRNKKTARQLRVALRTGGFFSGSGLHLEEGHIRKRAGAWGRAGFTAEVEVDLWRRRMVENG